MDDSLFVRLLKRFRNLLGDTERVIDNDGPRVTRSDKGSC
jgi:hypothetical protein